jgi:hypothetical protein
MKKIIALCLVLVPVLGFSQKREVSVDKFFNKYSEIPEYESLQVTEDMFEMFKTMEDADDEMVSFMSKLKFVKYLEYRGDMAITAGITIVDSGESKAKTTNYYVDGKKVTASGKGGSTGIASAVSKAKGKATNYAPVNMSQSVVYNRAMDEIDISAYTQLMKSNQDGEKTILLKREWSATDKEFLLLSGNKMVNIRGDIDIKHLYQLDDILDGIVDVMDMYPF